MARYKQGDISQGLFLQVNLADQLIPGSFEHALATIVDTKVDVSTFDSRYRNDQRGPAAYPPKAMLKLVLYAYSRGILSSRDIEHLSRTNIDCMAVTGGFAPDHATIASFVSSMPEALQVVFGNVLLICNECGLISGERFAIDGVKLPSNASKEWSGTHQELERKRGKFEKIAKQLVDRHQAEDENRSSGPNTLKERADYFEKQASRIAHFLTTHKPRLGPSGKEIKSNVTDPQSAKMPSSKGVIQGYNGLALVDDKHQVVVYAQAFGSGQEHQLLPPFFEGATALARDVLEDTNFFRGKTVLADTGYFSEENLRILDTAGARAFIPDNQFRKRDITMPRRQEHHKPSPRTPYRKDQFMFNQETNAYTCPEGKILKHETSRTVGGHVGHGYEAKKDDCQACHAKGLCVKKGAVRRTIFKVDSYTKEKNASFSRKMIEKIDTPAGRLEYSTRMGIVEPVFANIRSAKGMNRFMLRTQRKVNGQWLLYTMVHNIGKIWRFSK